MAVTSNLLDEALSIFNTTNTSSISPPSMNNVILIEDCVETSAAFVIHHILKRCLNPFTSFAVFLFLSPILPLTTIAFFANSVATWALHRDNGRIFFFDLLMLECQETDRDEAKMPKDGLIELYGKIQRVVEDIASSSESTKHITIIIDDFSLVEVAAKGSLNHSLDFLQYCHTSTSEAGCLLVILNNEDIYSGEGSLTLILQMEYLANILIKAEPLATGLAADVHGQLTVLNKGISDLSRSSTNKMQNFHFKIMENSIECFYPGTRG